MKLRMKSDGKAAQPLRLHSFTYADFDGDKSDCKSMLGVMVTINGVLIGWQCATVDRCRTLQVLKRSSWPCYLERKF